MKKLLFGPLFVASAVLVGLFIGFKAFQSNANIAAQASGIENGPWTTSEAYGDQHADPMLKSAVAMSGLLALKASETIYFTASHDDEGMRLVESCNYLITGRSPRSRWSSITLYDEDHYLIPNDDKVYSQFLPEPGAEFEFLVSPKRPDSGAWLASLGGGKLSMTLRIYNPAQVVYENLASITLPNITRGACQ